MKVIVDANIVFSGILNTKGKIGDLLINSYNHFYFIAPNFLRTEIKKHYQKICELSKLPLDQIIEAEFQICKDIQFISEEQIHLTNWKVANELVQDIDAKDIQYIAFSKQFRCKLWSGDKRLSRGLAHKGFKQIITTDELFAFREQKERLRLKRR